MAADSTTRQRTVRRFGRPRMPVGKHGNIRCWKDAASGRWIAETRVSERTGTRKIQRRAASKTKATERLQEAIGEHRGQTKALHAGSPFRDVATQWVERLDKRLKAGKVSAATHTKYRGLMRNYILPTIGDVPLSEIDTAFLEDVISDLDTGAVIQRQVRRVIRGCLRIAVKRRAIPANPASDMELIEGAEAEPARSLTAAERADLLAKLDADPRARRADLPDLVRVALATGVRIGELVNLRWRDIDFVGIPADDDPGVLVPVVHVTQGKTKTARRPIPMSEWLVTLLARRRERIEWARDDDPVFAAGAHGQRTTDAVRQAWRAFRTRVGYEWVIPHTWRKTYNTMLDEQGLVPRKRADVLGHAQIATTIGSYDGRRQVHRAAAKAIDAALGSVSG